MGIINDFIAIETDRRIYMEESKDFFLYKKIKNNKIEKRLDSNINKLRTKTNVPLSKHDILELLSNIYNMYPDKQYKNCKIIYYPNSSIFRLSITDIDNPDIMSFCIELASNKSKMYININMYDNKNREMYKSYGFESKELNTNIKEIRKSISYMNNILYNIIADIIEERIKIY